jgi:paraquat-inducible protein A
VRSSVLIRALVLGSLALLVAGAVTPLLTTTQFYFFSNTFSLSSGLRQLVANQQFLVAALIVLFSFCVPVIKAVVIWLASSGHTSSRPLLKLADRFGKWSMLEVFVAALLITALKLGPVVNATMHYGAWLLAGSVLLSGAASQLVAHEPHEGSIFSSPVTLTIGAVGGAVAAAVLIGLLNPQLLRFESILGTPESRCIERVLRADRVFAATSGNPTDHVRGLRTIDAASCPEEFREAFDDYVDAWAKLVALDASDGEAPGWFDRVGALVGLIATRDDRLEDIGDAWAEVAKAAVRYGVEAPEK